MESTAPATTVEITAERRRKTLALLNSNRFRWWMLAKLPMAYLLGLRVKQCSASSAAVSIPFKWLSQNPFRSIYFAAQCSAAELSTGLLVIASTANHPALSTLLLRVEADYHKKAVSRTVFTCEDGPAIHDAVRHAIRTGEGVTVTASSEGIQENGEVVSRMQFTWSIKVRSTYRVTP